MPLRLQLERQSSGIIPCLAEYAQFYGLMESRHKNLKKGAIILHPGPMNRGAEIDSFSADCNRSKILEQVTAGLAVRMALLEMLLT
jgi:aspartate carbamoyltransferase catalytic subunit